VNEDLELRFVILEHGKGLDAPGYATAGAAGIDLRAAIEGKLRIAPGARVRVPTGLAVAIPHGYEGQVRGRSGLASRYGIGLPNAPGTIDSDYRGEIQVILINWGEEEYVIERGERIAQLVIAPVACFPLRRVDGLDQTTRGRGGFGHTGSR